MSAPDPYRRPTIVDWLVGLVVALILIGSALVGDAGSAHGSVPAPAHLTSTNAPYGGCKEVEQGGHVYVKSSGARWCRRHGWTVRARLVVDPHRWVRFSSLPHCANEDGSGGPLPCTWNLGPGIDGNGQGRVYWIDLKDRTHYVKGWR